MTDTEKIAKQYERKLLRQLSTMDGQLSDLFKIYTDKTTEILNRYRINQTSIFTNSKEFEREILEVTKQLKSNLEISIFKGQKEAWDLAREQTTNIIDKYVEKLPLSGKYIYEKGEKDQITGKTKLTNTGIKKYDLNARSLQAYDAFKNRKIAGMNLSDRVWKLAKDSKSKIEYFVESGMATGRSTNQMARDIQGLLNEPNNLFRRVPIKDKDGKTIGYKPSKAMLKYREDNKPGRGKYLSSYQNARRLARTEINMAYRQSDMESWRDIDFVLGYEVILSNAHSIIDICDAAQGKYPKEFTFTGWHPACMCHAVPILMTPDQFDSWVAGEPVNAQYINDVPQGMKDWLNRNKEQIDGWKNKPYFMLDNAGMVDKIQSGNDIYKYARYVPPME